MKHILLIATGGTIASRSTDAGLSPRICADDLLCTGSRRIWFCGKRVSTKNTHGTGCTLSSAIASNLAQGLDMEQSVRRAKEYVSGALAAGLELGHGSGPLNHLFDLHSRFIQNSFSQTE